MSGNFIALLERDPELLRLATLNAEPNTLLEHAAHALVRARRIEGERQIRREREADEWRIWEERRNARAVAPPPAPPVAPAEPPDLTEKQVLPLIQGIAKAVWPELDAIKGRLAEVERRAHSNGDVWLGRVEYSPGEVVRHNGSTWICRARCRGHLPTRRPQSWEPYPPAAAASPSPELELQPLRMDFGKDRRR